MGKEKIVLDTKILISALGWNGKPKQIFNRIISGDDHLLKLKEFNKIKIVTATEFIELNN